MEIGRHHRHRTLHHAQEVMRTRRQDRLVRPIVAIPDAHDPQIPRVRPFPRGVDEFGNEFRYRAKVYDATGKSMGRWSYDVFLKNQ